MKNMGNTTAAIYLRRSTEEDGKSVGAGLLHYGELECDGFYADGVWCPVVVEFPQHGYLTGCGYAFPYPVQQQQVVLVGDSPYDGDGVVGALALRDSQVDGHEPAARVHVHLSGFRVVEGVGVAREFVVPEPGPAEHVPQVLVLTPYSV